MSFKVGPGTIDHVIGLIVNKDYFEQVEEQCGNGEVKGIEKELFNDVAEAKYGILDGSISPLTLPEEFPFPMLLTFLWEIRYDFMDVEIDEKELLRIAKSNWVFAWSLDEKPRIQTFDAGSADGGIAFRKDDFNPACIVHLKGLIGALFGGNGECPVYAYHNSTQVTLNAGFVLWPAQKLKF